MKVHFPKVQAHCTRAAQLRSFAFMQAPASVSLAPSVLHRQW